MFSFEIFEISRNTFFTEHLWTTGSEQGPKYVSDVQHAGIYPFNTNTDLEISLYVCIHMKIIPW